MMTLDERLAAIEQLRDVLDMTEGYLAELGDDRDKAKEELRSAIDTLKVQIEAWNQDVSAILERRARIGAELEKASVARPCGQCGATATSRSVGNIEDVLAFVVDAEPLDMFLPELVGELQALCGACFGSKLRGLEALAHAVTHEEPR